MIPDRHILEEVSRINIQLLLREPFYAHLLSALNKSIVPADSTVKTLALGRGQGSYVLYINPIFWRNPALEPDWRYGLLKHEILHLILKHPLIHEPELDAELMHIAMDLVVNQYISSEHLSPEALLLHQFPELSLQPDQTWMYYYQRLAELQNHQFGRYRTSQAIAFLDQLQKGNNIPLDRHQFWPQYREIPSVERSILEGVIDQRVSLAYQKAPRPTLAKLPGRLQIYLEKLLSKTKPLIDWKRAIRIFAASSTKTRIKNTIRRTSKRYGSVPGIQVKRLRKLLIAVDTSGSITQEEIQIFFHEIYHIWRQGAEIHLVECDAAIQNSYPYQGQMPTTVFGGGDTNFDAPIRYGNQHFLPDGLIYLTDGFASRPTIKARFPILWVISADGLDFESDTFRNLPGRKAKLSRGRKGIVE